jgi:hypothetical protein
MAAKGDFGKEVCCEAERRNANGLKRCFGKERARRAGY